LIGLLSGAVAGLVIGGIGGRIAMRIVTDSLGKFPEFTVATLAVLLIGTWVGIPSGLLFTAARRYLPGPWFLKGLFFGIAFLLILGGPFFLRPPTGEFVLSPVLGKVLFAILVVLYGIVVAAVVQILERYLPDADKYHVAMLVGAALLAIPGLLGLVGLLQTFLQIPTD